VLGVLTVDSAWATLVYISSKTVWRDEIQIDEEFYSSGYSS
jgi:hypothetical protein